MGLYHRERVRVSEKKWTRVKVPGLVGKTRRNKKVISFKVEVEVEVKKLPCSLNYYTNKNHSSSSSSFLK